MTVKVLLMAWTLHRRQEEYITSEVFLPRAQNLQPEKQQANPKGRRFYRMPDQFVLKPSRSPKIPKNLRETEAAGMAKCNVAS